MSTATTLIIGAALACSCLDVLYRYAMQHDYDPYAIVWYNLTAGGLLLLLFRGLPQAGLGGGAALPILLASSAFWALQAWLDIKAFQGLPASVNATLNAAGLIALNLAGVIVFAEGIGAAQAAGLVLIVCSMFVEVDLRAGHERRGTAYRAGAVICGTLALVLDKRLTMMISTDWVLLCGYLGPALIMLVMRPAVVRQAAGELKRHWLVLGASAVLYALVGFGIIVSISLASLGATMSIYQLRIVFTFLLAAVLLRERERFTARAAGAALAIAGIMLVAAG